MTRNDGVIMRRREIAIRELGGKCQTCGDEEYLTFVGGGRSPSKAFEFGEEKLKEYLKNSTLLCEFCARSLRKRRKTSAPVHGTTACYKTGCRNINCIYAAAEYGRGQIAYSDIVIAPADYIAKRGRRPKPLIHGTVAGFYKKCECLDCDHAYRLYRKNEIKYNHEPLVAPSGYTKMGRKK